MSGLSTARLAIALPLAALVAGCGGASGPTHTSPPSDRQESYRDGDDESVLAYGRPAGTADTRAITALIERYYAAAAARDGARACSLTADGLAATIPTHYEEELGSEMPPGHLAVPRGVHSCAAVLSVLFGRLHTELAAPVTVTSVRVKGGYGYGLVGSPTLPASSIMVSREGNSWRIDGLLGQPVP